MHVVLSSSLPKLNQVILSPTHTNTTTKTRAKTRTKTRAKTRTKMWPTDTPTAVYPIHIRIQPIYTTNTPMITPTKAPTNTLTAELLCPCYHVTW